MTTASETQPYGQRSKVGCFQTRWRVIYIKNGREIAGPWLYDEARATRALAAIQRRVGTRGAILFMD